MNIKVFFVLSVINFILHLKSSIQTCEIIFNRDVIKVYFNPRCYDVTSSRLRTFNESNLNTMLHTISSRFSKLEMPSVSKWQVNGNKKAFIVQIPNAIARFNLNQTSQYKNNSTKPNLLELTMTFKTGRNDENFSFDVVKHLADEANTIFPNTVQSLSVWSHTLRRTNTELLGRHLRYERNILRNSSFPYKLGTNIDISVCEGSQTELNGYFQQVIPLLDYVYFDLVPRDEDLYIGIDLTVPNYIKRMKTCIAKMMSFRSVIVVGFGLSWPDTDWNGNQNISSLVHFWERMNFFASSSNTPLILAEVFDIPNANLPFNTQGWWKLKNTPGEIFHEYEFEEKCSLVANISLSHNSTQEVTPLRVPTTAILETVDWDGTTKPRNSIDTPTTENVIEISSTQYIQTGITTVYKISQEENIVEETLLETWGIPIGASGAAGIVIFVIIILIYKRKVRKIKNSYVTEEEMVEFFEGNTYKSVEQNGDPIKITGNLAYDTSLELSLNEFQIDETVSLGSGEFGTVALATIYKGSLPIATAVKISKQNNSMSLKSLMCEIKVLSYIGEHENIVQLFGAHTKDLQKGLLYVFLELCPLGSLETYLRKRKNPPEQNDSSTYQTVLDNSVDHRLHRASNINDNHIINENVICGWCREIVSGMKYLAEKHLVHGDLATRNVLLDRNRKAKICDFGLSRRLYDYVTYQKTNVEPLPWRWMSPESLCRLEFTEKTDVWAFGVTMWEIFSFGDVPYPGLSWTVDFVVKLESGLRLQKPAFCPEDIYCVMKSCWDSNPGSRPAFSELFAEFP